MNYNRSDGLVKSRQRADPGAPRAFVHKCHGGDGLADHLARGIRDRDPLLPRRHPRRLRLMDAQISKGGDFFGKSEFFIGVSLKPRGVDFDLFHQSKRGRELLRAVQQPEARRHEGDVRLDRRGARRADAVRGLARLRAVADREGGPRHAARDVLRRARPVRHRLLRQPHLPRSLLRPGDARA